MNAIAMSIDLQQASSSLFPQLFAATLVSVLIALSAHFMLTIPNSHTVRTFWYVIKLMVGLASIPFVFGFIFEVGRCFLSWAWGTATPSNLFWFRLSQIAFLVLNLGLLYLWLRFIQLGNERNSNKF
ncbi:MAG: hypothetical protein AAF614_43725 [Chloroflexota bacterium]